MPLKRTEDFAAGDQREENLRNTVVKLRSRTDYVKEINRLWREANDKFITIGQYLIQAKQVLPHGEYQPMIERDLPFRPAVARMIVTATQAIINETLPADRLPPSYSTVYLLTTLSAEQLAAAERQGLVRPDVTRSEVVSFKRSLSGAGSGSGSDPERLRLERSRLLAEQRRIEMRLREIEASLDGAVIDEDGRAV